MNAHHYFPPSDATQPMQPTQPIHHSAGLVSNGSGHFFNRAGLLSNKVLASNGRVKIELDNGNLQPGEAGFRSYDKEGFLYIIKLVKNKKDPNSSVLQSEKWYECTEDNCKYDSERKNNLKRHAKTHHPESRLPCPYLLCPQTFIDNYTRRRHFLEKHPNSVIPSSMTPIRPRGSKRRISDCTDDARSKGKKTPKRCAGTDVETIDTKPDVTELELNNNVPQKDAQAEESQVPCIPEMTPMSTMEVQESFYDFCRVRRVRIGRRTQDLRFKHESELHMSASAGKRSPE